MNKTLDYIDFVSSTISSPVLGRHAPKVLLYAFK